MWPGGRRADKSRVSIVCGTRLRDSECECECKLDHKCERDRECERHRDRPKGRVRGADAPHATTKGRHIFYFCKSFDQKMFCVIVNLSCQPSR